MALKRNVQKKTRGKELNRGRRKHKKSHLGRRRKEEGLVNINSRSEL